MMSKTIATYSFLPWLRMGVANKITTAQNDASVKLRATVKVEIDIVGDGVSSGTQTETISKDVQLFGPGDVVGIDKKAIVRTEPHNWITNFESNYLPYIEFYDEDFPWRYTPAAPDMATDRLTPWLTLAILKEGDFTEGKNLKDKPLSYITVQNASAKFPAADQLWAWAHVHVNESLLDKIVAAPGDDAAVVTTLQSILNNNPDHASSRILCPIKLDANTAYHAFLIPTFETGRMAGLGQSMKAADLPADLHAGLSAWANYTGRKDADDYPFYHRWYFRTGTVGDFEYLVRLLKPGPVDKRVGRKDIDVQVPGSSLRGITDPVDGILKLGGALQVPFDTMIPEDKKDVLKFENWDQPAYPHPFQKDLSEFINLNDDYSIDTSKNANAATALPQAIKDDCDPLITPPLYGRWHALVQRLLTQRDGAPVMSNNNWIHELNLDPRWRIAAGYGTKVVQENQELYMEAAWKQVGDILEANRKMRLAQLAKETSVSWYAKQVAPLIKRSPDKAMTFTAPVQKRILSNGLTFSQQVERSVVSRSLTSIPMRRISRPGSKVMKTLNFTGQARAESLITRVNEGHVVIARPKVVAPVLPGVEALSRDLLPKNVSAAVVSIVRSTPALKWIALILIAIIVVVILLGGLTMWSGILSLIAAGLVGAFFKIQSIGKQIKIADSISEKNETPIAVDEMPKRPNFVISEIGSPLALKTGNTDSVEATKFKMAMKDQTVVFQTAKAAGAVTPRPKLDIQGLVSVTFTSLNPDITIPKMIFGSILIPDRIRLKLTEQFVEAMAYPEIDVPMYKPLVDISSELFLPNINFISQNTISLLETNQRFIESYMVGLNHEFSRELLWREYPTDQRGSYFRQFWDVSAFFSTNASLDEEALKEKLRDIPPLHHWSLSSMLGDHDNREQGAANEEELVLVIRGELLKKYPNAVIYAQRAAWPLKADGTIDLAQERKLIELSDSESDNPLPAKVKTPLYEAKVDPDIYFFGFDLTATEARGGTGEQPADKDHPGWFFCIKERPGEPRFGLDIDPDNTPNLWNDLSWKDVMPGVTPGSFIQINNSTTAINLSPLDLPEDAEKQEQRPEDLEVKWDKNMNSAQAAYILYQVPVLVAVHASEMLPK